MSQHPQLPWRLPLQLLVLQRLYLQLPWLSLLLLVLLPLPPPPLLQQLVVVIGGSRSCRRLLRDLGSLLLLIVTLV
jgi:hypothetical protein